MLRFFDAANLVTLIGLSAGVGCALYAAAGRARFAIVALIVAGLCDFLDGAVARALSRSDEERRFGGNLDTVVDACCFGMAPAVLLYAIGLRSPAEMALIVAFVMAAAWRLAYFDTVGLGGEGAQRYYTGLPVTYVALVLPLALLSAYAGPHEARVAGAVSAGVLTVAMVAPIRMPKPRGAAYIVFPLIAVVTATVYLVREL